MMLGFLKRTLHQLFTMSHNENPVVPVKRPRRESKADESGEVMFLFYHGNKLSMKLAADQP